MEFRMKKSVEALGPRWSRTRDRGATAVVIALCLLLVMAAAAMSFDTANLALQRQTLRNVTDAAAQAGASYLPGDPVSAIAAVTAYAHRYDPSFNPTISLWCMVASTGATKQPASGPMPCKPGGSGTYVNGVGGVVCDTVLCAIPCTGATGTTCNTMKVDGQRNVPFYFAPAIGINSGSTGAVTSVSCHEPCGTVAPNPMDVAIVADRTPSMSNSDFSSMQAGIASTLGTMTPEYQSVTLGTIHRSQPTAKCATTLGPAISTKNQYYVNGGSRTGKWMPLGFSNDYLTGTIGTSRSLNSSSSLVKGVNCMDHYDSSQSSSYPWGTHLAAPLKAAARLLLGIDSSNLGNLATQRASLLPVGSQVTQAILFETDGYPEETMGLNSKPYADSNTSKGSTVLTGPANEPTAPQDAATGCQNMIDVASAAKTQGIKIIMIAYGGALTGKCGTKNVRDVMATAASNAPSGSPSTAPTDCAKANSDGDYYFCAANGADLQGIFVTAMGSLSHTTKFVKMPS